MNSREDESAEPKHQCKQNRGKWRKDDVVGGGQVRGTNASSIKN